MFGQHQIDAISEAGIFIKLQGLTEPIWLFVGVHSDRLSLMRAARCGIHHLIGAEHLGTPEILVTNLRAAVTGELEHDAAVEQMHRLLGIASDNDDQKILQLLVAGRSNKEIADEIYFAEQTVKNRLSRMMKAAAVHNRTELAMLFANF